MGREKDGDLTALETALASLTPAAGGVDRDELMFRAGRASAPRSAGLWRPLACAATLVAVVFGAMLVGRPPEPVVERVRHVATAQPEQGPAQARAVLGAESPPAVAAPQRALQAAPGAGLDVLSALRSHLSYLELRNRVVAEGAEALPVARAAQGARPPMRYGPFGPLAG